MTGMQRLMILTGSQQDIVETAIAYDEVKRTAAHQVALLRQQHEERLEAYVRLKYDAIDVVQWTKEQRDAEVSLFVNSTVQEFQNMGIVKVKHERSLTKISLTKFKADRAVEYRSALQSVFHCTTRLRSNGVKRRRLLQLTSQLTFSVSVSCEKSDSEVELPWPSATTPLTSSDSGYSYSLSSSNSTCDSYFAAPGVKEKYLGYILALFNGLQLKLSAAVIACIGGNLSSRQLMETQVINLMAFLKSQNRQYISLNSTLKLKNTSGYYTLNDEQLPVVKSFIHFLKCNKYVPPVELRLRDGVGWGVFASSDIDVGEIIDVVAGEIKPKTNTKFLREQGVIHTSDIINIPGKLCLVAAHYCNSGIYLNGVRNDAYMSANVLRLPVICNGEIRVLLIAVKKISVYDELLCHYGTGSDDDVGTFLSISELKQLAVKQSYTLNGNVSNKGAKKRSLG